MNLQSRKLKAIEYLIGLRDEKTFRRIESVIAEAHEEQMSPLTQEQLIERAKQSTEDYISGRFISQEQLEEESKNW